MSLADVAASAASPVDDSLFFSLSPPRLAGSSCSSCSTVAFPPVPSCPCCSNIDVTRVELPGEGVLWSWTVQRFEPKSPYVSPAAGFEPYALGYVDLGQVLVESRLVGDADSFRIGERLSLGLLTLPPADTDTGPVNTFAFTHRDGDA